MGIREQVSLASLSTLRVGGNARYLLECETENDVLKAVSFAQEHSLLWRVLGEGSNILASDEGFSGVVIQIQSKKILFEEQDSTVLVTADAGVHWDDLVTITTTKGLWGIENLAGIPGTVGAAPVQNIGAYGSEVKDTIHKVRALDTTGESVMLSNADCMFGYRDSKFKHDASFIILSVTFALSKNGGPALSYKDLAVRVEKGEDLSTSENVAETVRAIRKEKFPSLDIHGTAGSFFKNPTISVSAYRALKERYEEIPGFPNKEGIKVPLAFVLDKILMLRGYRVGSVSLFERQPLVLVSDNGATAHEIDVFAHEIAKRVYDATGISIEREVRMFP